VRAIIIAAGMGRRLKPYTDDRPKCLVEVGGKSILARQLEAYRAAGVNEFAIVRGYKKERLVVDGARIFDNDEFERNNILTSLFYAEPALEGEVLVSYADIVFGERAVRAAMSTPGEIALVVDRRWRDAYVGRADHPTDEGEVCRVVNGRVEIVGKKTVPADEASGEFIGLARFSAAAVARMRARFHERRAALVGKPYGTAPRFEVAYLSDMLNDLISTGEDIRAAFIDGGWREIDTVEDLGRVAAVVDSL
jgi:choline kinase